MVPKTHRIDGEKVRTCDPAGQLDVLPKALFAAHYTPERQERTRHKHFRLDHDWLTEHTTTNSGKQRRDDYQTSHIFHVPNLPRNA